jgi:hypothetical protein
MMEESGNYDFMKDYLRVNIKTLKMGGLWNTFDVHSKSHQAYRVFSVFLSTIILLHVSTEVADLFYSWGDLENFSATASNAFTYGAALIKQRCYLANSRRIYRMVNRLRDGKLCPPSKWSQEQKNIANSYDRHVRTMSWCYYGLGIACLSCCVMSAIVSNSIQSQDGTNSTEAPPRILPYRGVFPFDTEQIGYYRLTFSFQMLVIVFAPTVNIGIDTLFIGLVIHSCGQFEILKNALRNIKRKATEVLETERIREEGARDKVDRNVPEDNRHEDTPFLENLQQQMSKGLNDCLQHHQQILM